MAPSRALFRLAFATRTRPSPLLLSASAPKTQLSRTPPTLQRGRIHQSSSSFASARSYSQEAGAAPEPPDYLNDAELHIFNKVKVELDPVKLEVQDISGGCGSMYAIEIESAKFQGLSVIKQHKLVNQVLKEEIAGWHGVQLRTKAV